MYTQHYAKHIANWAHKDIGLRTNFSVHVEFHAQKMFIIIIINNSGFHVDLTCFIIYPFLSDTKNSNL